MGSQCCRPQKKVSVVPRRSLGAVISSGPVSSEAFTTHPVSTPGTPDVPQEMKADLLPSTEETSPDTSPAQPRRVDLTSFTTTGINTMSGAVSNYTKDSNFSGTLAGMTFEAMSGMTNNVMPQRRTVSALMSNIGNVTSSETANLTPSQMPIFLEHIVRNLEYLSCSPVEDLRITRGEMDLVLESWVLLENDMHKLGPCLFLELFEDHPSMACFFKKFESIKKSSTRFHVDENARILFTDHTLLVMQAVGKTISRIDDPESLIAHLHKVGLVHRRLGLRREDLLLMRPYLINTIKKSLPPELTESAGAAWTKYIHLILTVACETMKCRKDPKGENSPDISYAPSYRSHMS